jgi:hypothetical protein
MCLLAIEPAAKKATIKPMIKVIRRQKINNDVGSVTVSSMVTSFKV